MYLATPDIFDEVVFDIDNAFKTVALFSHNDGITHYANSLASTQIDNMPTCSIFAVKANAKSWKDFDLVKKEFWFFDYPKLG